MGGANIFAIGGDWLINGLDNTYPYKNGGILRLAQARLRLVHELMMRQRENSITISTLVRRCSLLDGS